MPADDGSFVARPIRRRRRVPARWALIGAAVAAALIVGVGLLLGDGGGEEGGPGLFAGLREADGAGTAESADDPEDAPELSAGSAAVLLDTDPNRTDVDGGVAFAVTDTRCGTEPVEVSGRTVQAEEGQLCVLTVTIANQGAEPVALDPLCQEITDGEGQKRPPVAGGGGSGFWSPIAAGETVVGPDETVEDLLLVYDVPESPDPAAVAFHASCDSGGAVIGLLP